MHYTTSSSHKSKAFTDEPVMCYTLVVRDVDGFGSFNSQPQKSQVLFYFVLAFFLPRGTGQEEETDKNKRVGAVSLWVEIEFLDFYSNGKRGSLLRLFVFNDASLSHEGEKKKGRRERGQGQ